MSGPRIDAEMAVLLDNGSAWTKASLIGRVRDRWRLVAHAAQPRRWGDAELVRALVRHAGESIDPRLRPGLEGLIATVPRIECHTPERAARLALVAVSRELSGSAARRAAEAAGWEVVVAASLDDGIALADRLARLRATPVDGWLLAGGFDGQRSPRAVEVAGLAAAARRAGSGPVMWAGDAALTDDVAALFEAGAVTAVPNPRPDAAGDDGEALRDELERRLRATVAAVDDRHVAQVSFRRAVGELARSGSLRVAAVDLGARYATRILAGADGATRGRTYSVERLTPGPARVVRGAGTPLSETAAADLLADLYSRPEASPQSDDELAVAHATAQLQLSSMAEDEPLAAVDLVVGAGRVLAAAPSPWQAAQMLLDGLRPIGVTQLAVDPANVLAPLGALGDEGVGEGMALLAEDLLAVLGTAVVCRGGQPGRVAMRVSVHRPGWPDAAPLEVRTGQLHLVALAPGQQAELTIEPSHGVSLGTPRRSPRIHAAATGGPVGIILDARGVPLALPRRADDRASVLAGWRRTLAREPHPAAQGRA